MTGEPFRTLGAFALCITLGVGLAIAVSKLIEMVLE